MEMRAYPDDYINLAQRILGDMFDFAINTCDMDIDEYYGMFLVSDVSRQFEEGNPTYIAGKTGCEIVKEVVASVGLGHLQQEDQMFIDKSPEYWTGWALAYYQWYTVRTFARINNVIKPSQICDMYEVYHEMDIMHFVERLNELWKEYYVDTNLKRLRKASGLSQSELAELSGVSIRQIQLFEQRQRDINHTKAIDVFRLARVLGCRDEALLEI